MLNEKLLYNTLFLCEKVLPIFGAMFKNVLHSKGFPLLLPLSDHLKSYEDKSSKVLWSNTMIVRKATEAYFTNKYISMTPKN